MKTITQCISESEDFLPSLKTLVTEAIEGGEYEDARAFVFIKTNSHDKIVVSSMITGNDIAVRGEIANLIDIEGRTLGDLQTLVSVI